MSYKISAKNRRLKRTLLNLFNIIKFEWLNIDMPRKIVFFGILIWTSSLFFNWIDAIDQKHIWNAFKNILWITWYLLIIINIKTLFIIFNEKIKEFFKSFFNFNAKDWVIIVFLWAFWLFLSINNIFVIQNFSYFTNGIIVWKWVIISIIWYVFCVFWGFLMLKTKTKTSIYMENKDNLDNYGSESVEKEKSNMKLPF